MSTEYKAYITQNAVSQILQTYMAEIYGMTATNANGRLYIHLMMGSWFTVGIILLRLKIGFF